MLGYVVSYRPELKVWESEIYKAYYCGVCKSIGRRYGQLPRMILSFDAAFLALVLDCICEDVEVLTNEGCIANPFKRKAIVHSKNVDFAADVMLILAWYKLLDDIDDEGRLYAKIATKLFKRKFKRIYENNRVLCDKIDYNLRILRELEKAKSRSLDKTSHYFAELMADIFQTGVENIDLIDTEKVMKEDTCQNENEYDEKEGSYKKEEVDKRQLLQKSHYVEIFREIGYNIGKWVYLIDAVDDIEENLQTGAYNPLIYRFNCEKDESGIDFKKRIKPQVDRILVICLEHIAKAVELLDVKKNKGILNNILYVGLLKKTDEILKEDTQKT